MHAGNLIVNALTCTRGWQWFREHSRYYQTQTRNQNMIALAEIQTTDLEVVRRQQHHRSVGSQGHRVREDLCSTTKYHQKNCSIDSSAEEERAALLVGLSLNVDMWTAGLKGVQVAVCLTQDLNLSSILVVDLALEYTNLAVDGQEEGLGKRMARPKKDHKALWAPCPIFYPF